MCSLWTLRELIVCHYSGCFVLKHFQVLHLLHITPSKEWQAIHQDTVEHAFTNHVLRGNMNFMWARPASLFLSFVPFEVCLDSAANESLRPHGVFLQHQVVRNHSDQVAEASEQFLVSEHVFCRYLIVTCCSASSYSQLGSSLSVSHWCIKCFLQFLWGYCYLHTAP